MKKVVRDKWEQPLESTSFHCCRQLHLYDHYTLEIDYVTWFPFFMGLLCFRVKFYLELQNHQHNKLTDFMSHLPESNQRQTDYKSVALPAELKWRSILSIHEIRFIQFLNTFKTIFPVFPNIKIFQIF
jgi:hypothetical protein